MSNTGTRTPNSFDFSAMSSLLNDQRKWAASILPQGRTLLSFSEVHTRSDRLMQCTPMHIGCRLSATTCWMSYSRLAHRLLHDWKLYFLTQCRISLSSSCSCSWQTCGMNGEVLSFSSVYYGPNVQRTRKRPNLLNGNTRRS